MTLSHKTLLDKRLERRTYDEVLKAGKFAVGAIVARASVVSKPRSGKRLPLKTQQDTIQPLKPNSSERQMRWNLWTQALCFQMCPICVRYVPSSSSCTRYALRRYVAVAYKDVTIREAVFFHRASKTLVVTDAVARIPYEVCVGY
jgi:hypothetical protein